MTKYEREFREELAKVMPGYKWTVSRGGNEKYCHAEGIMFSGFNRLATIDIVKTEKGYTVKSAANGKRAPWGPEITAGTLKRALRNLQDIYENKISYWSRMLWTITAGRPK